VASACSTASVVFGVVDVVVVVIVHAYSSSPAPSAPVGVLG
jgi:hypothetical protein